LIQLRFDPDPAAVPVDDTLANGKADTNAGNVFTVQSLEHAENSLVILGSDPEAIVSHRQTPSILAAET
jgi:hypothetical protein